VATDALDAVRSANYEIAEAIAPTWERRRADVEKVTTLRELRLHRGDTLLELAAAGVGETGFEAAAIVGAAGSPSSPSQSRDTGC